MATVISCSGGGGRVFAVDAQQAVPLFIGLSYQRIPGLQQLLTTGSALSASEIGALTQGALVRMGVVTQMQVQQQVIAQFQQALNGTVYITPFGDGIGDAQLAFVANRSCSGELTNGFDVIQHYLDRRLLPGRNTLPATLVVGAGAFRCFLTGLSIQGQAQDVPLIQGTLSFKAWPL